VGALRLSPGGAGGALVTLMILTPEVRGQALEESGPELVFARWVRAPGWYGHPHAVPQGWDQPSWFFCASVMVLRNASTFFEPRNEVTASL
jgi:hypothetical protein